MKELALIPDIIYSKTTYAVSVVSWVLGKKN
jgi:hypothetical protein